MFNSIGISQGMTRKMHLRSTQYRGESNLTYLLQKQFYSNIRAKINTLACYFEFIIYFILLQTYPMKDLETLITSGLEDQAHKIYLAEPTRERRTFDGVNFVALSWRNSVPNNVFVTMEQESLIQEHKELIEELEKPNEDENDKTEKRRKILVSLQTKYYLIQFNSTVEAYQAFKLFAVEELHNYLNHRKLAQVGKSKSIHLKSRSVYVFDIYLKITLISRFSFNAMPFMNSEKKRRALKSLCRDVIKLEEDSQELIRIKERDEEISERREKEKFAEDCLHLLALEELKKKLEYQSKEVGEHEKKAEQEQSIQKIEKEIREKYEAYTPGMKRFVSKIGNTPRSAKKGQGQPREKIFCCIEKKSAEEEMIEQKEKSVPEVVPLAVQDYLNPLPNKEVEPFEIFIKREVPQSKCYATQTEVKQNPSEEKDLRITILDHYADRDALHFKVLVGESVIHLTEGELIKQGCVKEVCKYKIRNVPSKAEKSSSEKRNI